MKKGINDNISSRKLFRGGILMPKRKLFHQEVVLKLIIMRIIVKIMKMMFSMLKNLGKLLDLSLFLKSLVLFRIHSIFLICLKRNPRPN